MKTLLTMLLLSGLWAANAAEDIQLIPPEAGSVSTKQGLQHWSRIYEVTSHPRCANCHVGDSPYPMWSGPSYGETRRHDMNIHAGASRIGVESIMCITCHRQSNSEEAHGAPGANASWRLAPVEAAWFGRSSNDICQQLRDPARNGGRTFEELAAHLNHDEILHWAWTPGGQREPAPYSLQEHVNDLLSWGVAGMPCPADQADEIRNDLGTSASDPVSALTPVSLQSSFTFVADKSERPGDERLLIFAQQKKARMHTVDRGHGDHVINSSARSSDNTAFNQQGRRVELNISSPLEVAHE